MKQAGQMLSEAVSTEERCYVKWSAVSSKFQKIYKDRNEMMKPDVQKVLGKFIFEGFNDVDQLRYENHQKVLAVKPKHLDLAQKREYVMTQKVKDRFLKYLLKVVNVTYPDDKTVIENAMKGNIYHTENVEGFVNENGDYVTKTVKSTDFNDENPNKKRKCDANSEIVKHEAKVSDLWRTRVEDAEMIITFLRKLKIMLNFTKVIDPMCGTGDLIDMCNAVDIPSYGSDKFNYPKCKKDFLCHTFSIPKTEVILSCPPFVERHTFVAQCLRFSVPTILLLPAWFFCSPNFIPFRECFTGLLTVSPRPKFINSKNVVNSPKGSAFVWYFFNFPVDSIDVMCNANKISGQITNAHNIRLFDYDRVNADIVIVDDDHNDDAIVDDDAELDAVEEAVVESVTIVEVPSLPWILINKDGSVRSEKRESKDSWAVSPNNDVFKKKSHGDKSALIVGVYTREPIEVLFFAVPPISPNGNPIPEFAAIPAALPSQ